MPRSLVFAAVLFFPGAAAAQPVAHKIEAADRQTVAATITYEVRTTAFAAARWSAYLPEPPELPSQAKVKTTAEPAGKVVAEKSPLARKVRQFDVPVANPVPGGAIVLRLHVRATLRARTLVPLAAGEKPPAVAPLTATEGKFYLAPSPRLDFDAKPFKDWLDAKTLRRKKGEPPAEFAARVLTVLRADFEYLFDPAEEKKASTACGRASTDCGGLTLLFVAAMRANDVPARMLVGRLALPRKAGSRPADLEYDRPHVRAEFFAAGVGWVPVEPSDANGDKDKPVAAFIGRDPGDLLVLHVDPDLRLPTAGGERTVGLLQLGPYYQAVGRGPFDGVLGPTGWEVTTTSIGEK